MKIQRLEAIRGFLAFFVFLAHFSSKVSIPLIGPTFRFAQEAVIGFFLLSGFVIYYAAHKKLSDGFRPYFVKRFLRIYSVFIPLLIVAWFLDQHYKYEKGFTTDLLGNLFMLQDFAYGKPGVIVTPLFGIFPLWSLAYEWWFYMLFYPIARYIPDKQQKHVVGIAGVVAAISYVFLPCVVNRILVYLTVWWIGVEAARLYCADERSLTLKNLRWPIAYTLMTAAPLLLHAIWLTPLDAHPSLGLYPWIEPRHLIAGIVLLLAGFAWRRFGWVGFSWTIGICASLSVISYSLYVAHWPLVVTATYLSAIGNPKLELALYVVGMIAFCVLTELVLFKWLRKRWA